MKGNEMGNKQSFCYFLLVCSALPLVLVKSAERWVVGGDGGGMRLEALSYPIFRSIISNFPF